MAIHPNLLHLALLRLYRRCRLLLLLLVRQPHDAATWPGARLCTVLRDRAALWTFSKTACDGLVGLSEWV